ncbi:DUF2867 domain-containing protein [Pseudoalteromonas sp. T1lg65]|uniref:DUF2867 domain-containing protein n=1 Tax=Pseudoalteromonas sp. T1lg65 TaxID=2077101 RepID=UPI003F79FB0B
MKVPSQSLLSCKIDTAYFYDSYAKNIDNNGQSAMAIYMQIAKGTPAWVNALMKLRNQIASKLGLKHLGTMGDFDSSKAPEAYLPGDKIGIFHVVSNQPNEVVLEDRDKHLDVRLSFLIEPCDEQLTLHATTVVHVKNTLGKIYMFFVAPVHRIIVPRSLKGL